MTHLKTDRVLRISPAKDILNEQRCHGGSCFADVPQLPETHGTKRSYLEYKMPNKAVAELEARLAGLTLAVDKKGTSCPFDHKVLQHALNVDRRTCERVVPMEVLVLGLSRTGTASIRHALFELGYFDVYHGSSYCNENPRDCEMWAEALRGKYENGGKFDRADWDQLFGHCMAVCDTPSYLFADELIAAYPEAKVILTVRDSAEAWKQSMMKTVVKSAIAFNDQSPLAKFLGLFLPKTPYQPMFALTTKHSRILHVPTEGEEMYRAHNDWVRSLVPKDNLLEFNVKQGWQPLCDFLEKEIPEKSFPRINSEKQYLETTKEFEQNTGLQALRNFAIVVVVPVTVAIISFMSVLWK